MGSEGKTTYHFKLNAFCVVLKSYTDKVEEGNKTPYGFAGTIFCIEVGHDGKQFINEKGLGITNDLNYWLLQKSFLFRAEQHTIFN